MKPSHDRRAPAYQEYAASMMANRDYRVLTIAGRGLLYSMRLECWENGNVPADPERLARLLGFDAADVQRELPGVMAFFETDGTDIFCPELDNYRAKLDDQRERQAAGGRKGADVTNGARKGSPTGTPAGTPRAGRRAPRESTRESLVQNSQDQNSQTHAVDGGGHAGWLSDYEKASRGA